jgi:large subunit ribosomal protein L6
MSRIGNKPIPLAAGVQINLTPEFAEVKGPKGQLTQLLHPNIQVNIDEENKVINVIRPDDEKQNKALHGLVRALLANAITGVSQGFEKTLKIVGTGYNVKLKGRHLELQVGFCLPKVIMIPDGLEVLVPDPTKIVVKGCDRQLVGQFTANVRAIRPPDSYKGKGIRHEGEVVKLKDGKSFGA